MIGSSYAGTTWEKGKKGMGLAKKSCNGYSPSIFANTSSSKEFFNFVELID
jgi:hypothetical protein